MTPPRPSPSRSGQTLTLGISGVRRNAAAAACRDGVLIGCCEQERVTRVRGARLEAGRLPVEAVEAVLRSTGGGTLPDVTACATAEAGIELPAGLPVTPVEHHLAHATGAFRMSPFDRAAVLVCDRHSTPPDSIWVAGSDRLVRRDWSLGTTGLAALYTACAEVFGFRPGQEHRLEALARLDSGDGAVRFESLIRYADGELFASPGWRGLVADWLAAGSGDPIAHRAAVASAFQRHLGDILLQLAADVRRDTGLPHLCVGGGLFYNTYFNAVVRQGGIFDDVFVPPNPGNAGASAGAALAAAGAGPGRAVSAFLGPGYESGEIKDTLDNCKLVYDYASENDVVESTVDALRRGLLVGWFQGRMEWGHRALGNRSILASPLSPYVLDNLNRFLKRREPQRAYGLSIPETAVPAFLEGPPRSAFMEFDYRILDGERLRHVLPTGVASLRIQTVSGQDEASRRFESLHEAFGAAAGVPALVNTSFNGFSEPIVCSPRDAIRVFFGTGLDVLVLDRFILRK